MKKNRSRTAAKVLVPVAALLLVSLALAAGCGGGSSGVTGVYKLKPTSDFTATITLKDGGQGTYSITEGAGIPISYEVEGNKVSLFGVGGKTALPNGVFKITDKGLEDPMGNVYVKQ